jgi:hypothetical protein
MSEEGAHERPNAAVKEAPLDHWVQWYAEHRRNQLLTIASSDGREVSTATKETGQPQVDPCRVGLQRLHQFLAQERPVLLFDLNQLQRHCNAQDGALQALDSLSAVVRKDHEPEENELDEGRASGGVSTALIDTLREQSDDLNEAILFYLSAVPVESRPPHLASFQEVLVPQESNGAENEATAPVSDRSEGVKARKVEADIASFLVHLESFFIQAMGEHAHRAQQGAAASSVTAFLVDELDEPSLRVLQDWLHAVQTCITAVASDSLSGTNENELVIRELSRTTQARTLTMRSALRERRDRAAADHDTARQQFLDAERQWNARRMEMSELRRDVEAQLATKCLVGDGGGAIPLLPRSSPTAPGVGTADLSGDGADVTSGGAPHRLTVRITDEPLQPPRTTS